MIRSLFFVKLHEYEKIDEGGRERENEGKEGRKRGRRKGEEEEERRGKKGREGERKSTHFFSSLMTDTAVKASSPVVGSSRNSTCGPIISSIPMLVRFLSPPDTPRKNSVPTYYSLRESI